MKKTSVFFLMIFFIFSIFSAFTQPVQVSNYGGKRMTSENSRFSVIGVKSEKSQKNQEFADIQIFLNSTVDSNSVLKSHILINNEPISPNSRFTFSKNGRSFSFRIKTGGEKFSLLLAEIKSFDGQTINPLLLNDIEEGNFWKFSKETKKWQKF